MFKNWKTTLAGIITGIPLLLHSVGVGSVGHFGNTDWLTLIGGLGAVLTGAVAKDHDVTGGTKPNS